MDYAVTNEMKDAVRRYISQRLLEDVLPIVAKRISELAKMSLTAKDHEQSNWMRVAAHTNFLWSVTPDRRVVVEADPQPLEFLDRSVGSDTLGELLGIRGTLACDRAFHDSLELDLESSWRTATWRYDGALKRYYFVDLDLPELVILDGETVVLRKDLPKVLTGLLAEVFELVRIMNDERAATIIQAFSMIVGGASPTVDGLVRAAEVMDRAAEKVRQRQIPACAESAGEVAKGEADVVDVTTTSDEADLIEERLSEALGGPDPGGFLDFDPSADVDILANQADEESEE